MSIAKFKEDFNYWLLKELDIAEYFRNFWRNIIPTKDTDVLDFRIEDKNWNNIWLELKSRRCKKDTYPTTMIWLNKLIETYKRYNDNWEYTLFLFNFEDWLYFINPFLSFPEFDYKQGRWDRGSFDKKKGYCYYLVEDLKLIKRYDKK